MLFKRSSGILLHPASLPGRFGIGNLGKEAYNFCNFLNDCGQKLWQVFPLGPTGYGDSPYQCFSAFAGNPLLVCPEKLKEEGLLSDEDLNIREPFDENSVDYGKVKSFLYPLFQKAYDNFKKKPSQDYELFCVENKTWLDDYALFMAIRQDQNGKSWCDWEEDIRLRKPEAVKRYTEKLSDVIAFRKFIQFKFFSQWNALKNYANSKNIMIIGDIPIFVAYNSSDAWANPEIFFFDKKMNSTKKAGVPPDYFSADGQLWGNPLYDWKKLKSTGYAWWIERFRTSLKLVDIIRLDHFRGFAAYWAVPAGEKTAINGKWEKAPGRDFFLSVKKTLGTLPLLAEDLGVITPDVEKLRDDFGFPGMKVLQFAFDCKPESIYLPHSYTPNSVVYTGTHDNDTTLGWFGTLCEKDKKCLLEYLGNDGRNICWDMISLAWASVSVLSVAPMQDLLCLGSAARMNTPGKADGNWKWRFRWNQVNGNIVEKLKLLTTIYNR